MFLYPAGAMVLPAGMFCILAFPPSGLFISKIMILKSMVFHGQWIILPIVIILLCFIVYAMSTRFMHIVFSNPRTEIPKEPAVSINPVETLNQSIFLGIIIILCFCQPQFLMDLIGLK